MGADRPVAVRGGSGGIEAHCDDLVEAARLFGRAADDTADQCVGLHGYLFDPGLYTSGVLDPGGVAEFESELLGALDGSHGLSWLAAECAAIDLALRAAASAYLAADHIDEIGRTWLGPALALPAAVAGGLSTLRATHNPATALSSVIDDDPGLADVAVDIAGGPTGPAARGLADAMPDGHPIVRDVGVDDDPIATRPPRRLADVMSALEVRDQGADGEIDVRFLERPDGRRSVIVDIPGTKSWDPIPNGDVTSVGTDVRATAGSSTSYERGVLQAMQRAGVRPDDDVMLVGHSEGGIVAVNAATRACEQASRRGSGYRMSSRPARPSGWSRPTCRSRSRCSRSRTSTMSFLTSTAPPTRTG